jgi:hypothetical protein
MAYYRRPSPLELTYLAQDSEQGSPFVNQYIVEGTGSVSLPVLSAAVRLAAGAVPESRLRLQGYWRFRSWHDDGEWPHVLELDASDWDGLSGENAPLLGTRMDPRKGPVCEVALLRGPSTRILFRTHHACMDGAGTVYFIRQVFKALRHEAVIPATSRLTEWDVARMHEPVARDVPLGGCSAPWPHSSPAWSPGCHWRRFMYPGRPSAIGGKMMAVINALAADSNANRVVVRMPADLRRYLDDGEFTASNCSAALDMDITGEHSPKKLQHSIIAAMRQKQDLASIVPAARHLHWFPLRMLKASEALKQKIHAAGSYNYSATVTNLGRLDPEHFSAPGFRCLAMFGVPIPLELTPLTIAFIQYEDNTAIHVSIPAALGSASDLHQLCIRIARLLDQIEEPRPRVAPVAIGEASSGRLTSPRTASSGDDAITSAA